MKNIPVIHAALFAYKPLSNWKARPEEEAERINTYLTSYLLSHERVLRRSMDFSSSRVAATEKLLAMLH